MEKKLNLGCGNHILKDFINIDNIPHCKDVYIDDIIYLQTFENDSVDFIYSSHTLQCIFPRIKVFDALKSWYRVLKPEGHIVIEVPDIVPLMKKYLNNKVPIETLIQGIYGMDKEGIRQFMCFDFVYLGCMLTHTGFLGNKIRKTIQPSYSRHDPNTNLVVEAWK